jgi:tRNA threonylcarbamoyladenosine biosynthesis protein TsaB
MSVVLALETATEGFGIAICQHGQLLSRSEVMGRGHAEAILPTVTALLASAQLSPSQIDAIAFDRGPGAFTGVRIALAAAQGLGIGWNRPLVGVSSLACLAYPVWSSSPPTAADLAVLALLDARMGEVYWARLTRDAVLGDQFTQGVTTPQALMQLSIGPVGVGRGHGFKAYPELAGHFALRDVDPTALPSVEALAQLGAEYLARGLAVEAAAAQAVYLRDQVAHRA